jgi:hypothetical protein
MTAGNLLCLFRQFVDLRKDRQDFGPQLRQLHGARAQEELTTELGLKPPHSIAYGGLPHTAFLGRPTEALLPRDGKAVTNLLQIHCTFLFDLGPTHFQFDRPAISCLVLANSLEFPAGNAETVLSIAVKLARWCFEGNSHTWARVFTLRYRTAPI